MVKQVIMPQFGESVVEGTLTRWLKRVGERVEQHEALVEINTDKVDTELPSPASGILLKILVEEGSTAQAGSVLALIGEPDEALSPAPAERLVESVAEPPQTEPTLATPLQPTPSQPPPRMGKHDRLGFISPLVAKMAREHQIDLSQVHGTGLGGRITKQDILDYLAASPPVPSTPIELPPAREAVPAQTSLLPGDEIQPLSVMRRRIAEHMVLSERSAPHATTVMEADLTRVVAHRQEHKARYAQSGVNLTYTAYFVYAAVAALKLYPIVNSSWHEQGILIHRQINIGIATALEDGLIVPVIHQADSLSLLGLARKINDLAERARKHNLQPEEVQNGTFTLTNHGVSGSLFATPIINPPQCAILGVGAIQKRPVVIETEAGEALAIRPMVYLSLTFDHRILDGAVADHFLAKIVSTLEGWESRE